MCCQTLDEEDLYMIFYHRPRPSLPENSPIELIHQLLFNNMLEYSQRKYFNSEGGAEEEPKEGMEPKKRRTVIELLLDPNFNGDVEDSDADDDDESDARDTK